MTSPIFFRLTYAPIFLILFLVLASPANSGEWVTDPDTGCSLWDEYASPDRIASYDGSCVNGKAEGQGEVVWSSGGYSPDQYTGEFRAGKRHGRGFYNYGIANGLTYEGEWENDRWNGNGVLTTRYRSMKWVYAGTFTDGKQTGRGVYTDHSGNRYEGEWKDGKKHGYGKLEMEISSSSYEGEWKENKFHGHGIYTWRNGTRYEGEFRNGKEQGKGKKTFADGSIYEGQWHEGKLHGHGTMTYKNGYGYSGEFKEGLPDGVGVAFGEDGTQVPVKMHKGKPLK